MALLSAISLKSLKTAVVVAQMGNITHAAIHLNRSQTAISKAILTLIPPPKPGIIQSVSQVSAAPTKEFHRIFVAKS